MGKFMFVFRGGDHPTDLESPEAMQAHMQKWKVWMDDLGAQGKLIGGEPLYEAGNVLSGAGGSVVTDGPFAEGKELVGGYLMVNSEDLNEATALAKGCPVLDSEGTVEVREVRDISQM